MTEVEVAADFAAVMEKVGRGAEVIVERGTRPVAVIGPARFGGRSFNECIALLEEKGSHVIPNEVIDTMPERRKSAFRGVWFRSLRGGPEYNTFYSRDNQAQ